jgi:two-component system LytT family sensor kinase
LGDNLLVEKQIEASCINYYLPPLSLQLLVENAIKHNEVSKTHPLTIKIVSNGEYIAVTNNLKLKFIKQDSPGIGLKNLKERYHHLTNLKPEFYIKNNEYIAKVPLIKEE